MDVHMWPWRVQAYTGSLLLIIEAEDMEFLVVNAQHTKAVPGRKTEVKDAEWICQLLLHGLIKASFIPDRNQPELRELVHYRRSIIDECTRQHKRIQEVLEGTNIKLGSLVSHIMSVSAKNMFHAIVKGVDDPEELSNMTQRTLKKKKNDHELALQGQVSPLQGFIIRPFKVTSNETN